MAEKYQRWHDQIIRRARLRSLDCYSEWHHIVPRSLGGSDDKSNLVQLTYREHFLVHWLLTKICLGADRRKMVMALHCMIMPFERGRTIASWRIEVSKRSLRREWVRRAQERHVRELDRQQAALARIEANKATIAEWAAANEPWRHRDDAGRFRKVKRVRTRRRAARKLRLALAAQKIAI